MKVVCVYRENQDYSRAVFEWLENFRRRTGRAIEVIDPDQNPNFCETYDIVEYPTILAIGENGEIHASWRGQTLPLTDEVLYYMI